MKIKWLYKLWNKSEDIFTAKAWGEPSFWTIFKEGNWYCQIQFNGEMSLTEETNNIKHILNTLNNNI